MMCTGSGTGFFTALLSRLFERHHVAYRLNPSCCFRLSPDCSTGTRTKFSTCFSVRLASWRSRSSPLLAICFDIKWLLAVVYVLLAVVLLERQLAQVATFV
jgi:hypothetical protein